MSGGWTGKKTYSHRLKFQLEKQGHKEVLYVPVYDGSQPEW